MWLLSRVEETMRWQLTHYNSHHIKSYIFWGYRRAMVEEKERFWKLVTNLGSWVSPEPSRTPSPFHFPHYPWIKLKHNILLLLLLSRRRRNHATKFPFIRTLLHIHKILVHKVVVSCGVYKQKLDPFQGVLLDLKNKWVLVLVRCWSHMRATLSPFLILGHIECPPHP